MAEEEGRVGCHGVGVVCRYQQQPGTVVDKKSSIALAAPWMA